MPTNEYSRADFLRALLTQQKRNTAMGGSLVNPSVANGSDLEEAATIDTTIHGNTPINGSVVNFDVEKAREEQERAGHTGNWFLDALDNIFGFVDEIAAKFGAGFVSAWEGILDLGATVIGAFGDWTGWYSSDPFTKWAEQDIGTAAAEWTKTYMNLNPWSWIRKAADGTYSNPEYWNDMFEGGKDILDSAFFASNELKDYREDADKYYRYNDEVLEDMGQVGEFLGGAAHSIGFMLPSIMTGGAAAAAGASSAVAQGVSLASMGVMAAGKGSEEALKEGADASHALGYGLASGAVEVASEIVVGKALGVVGLGTGKIMGVVGNGASKQAVKVGSNAFIKELGKTMFEEGMEEVFSAVMEPVTKSIYKGTDAFKNTYSNPDWWFGTNGHFNESVLGQFASGAFVGGISGGIQTAPVYKKLGSTNYNTMQSFREVAEIDSQMAKMEKQRGFDPQSAKYQKLVNERAEAMSHFIENMNTSLQKSTSSQNKYLAELLTNKGALSKALAEGDNDVNVAVTKYLNKVSTDYGTHEKAITRSFFNDLQAKYGTDYDIEFTDLGVDNNGNAIKGSFDGKTLKLNEKMLNTHAGKVLAHEYFAHGLSKKMGAGNVRAMFNDVVNSNEGKSILEKVKKAYPELGTSNSNIRIQEEVLAHYLERVFSGKNVATQLNNIKKSLTENKFNRFFDNIIDAFNKTEKMKSDKVVKEYAKVLNQWLKYGDNNKNLVSKTLRKIVYKEYTKVELNDFEKSIKEKYSKLVTILESQVGESIAKDVENATPDVALAFSKDIDLTLEDDEFDLTPKEKKELDELLDFLSADDIEDMLKESVKDKELWEIAEEKQVKPADAVTFDGTEDAIIALNEVITPEVKEYFKDSVIKSNRLDWFDGVKDGKYLIPMYHGTPNSYMYFFDSKRIGEHGTQRGHGFYLTDCLELAKSYSEDYGKVIIAFMNITNPASETKLTITKEQVKEFVRKHIDRDATQGTLSNYGDVSMTSYEKILNTFVDGIFDYGGHSDLDLIEQLYREQTDLDYMQFFRDVQKDWGFDGYLFKNRAEGTIAVAWFSEQIKDINNTSPTDSKDIRYSKDIDGNVYQVLYDSAGKPFFRSPFTYEGNKYSLLPDLMSAFPKKETFTGTFIEAFAGSAVVSANAEYKNRVVNELNPYVHGLHKVFKEQNVSQILSYIFNTIDKYQIRTKEGFDNFKKQFNETKPESRNPLDLFILQKASSSGSLLWFDENENFKGNWSRENFLFNKTLLKDTILQYNYGLKDVKLTNKDAIDIINEAKSGDFIYVDPPYSNTNATYNENWTEIDDKRLMEALDRAAERGVGFALSNVFEYNGKENKLWKEWAKKYNTQHLDKKYFKGDADEVLIKHKGDYGSNEIDRQYNWYKFNKNEIERYTKNPEEIYKDSKIYSKKWRSALNNLLRKRTAERLKIVSQIYSGEISILDEYANDFNAIDHFFAFLDDIQNEGKVQILDKEGRLKQTFWTPEMLLLGEEYKKMGGSEIQFNLNKKVGYVGQLNPTTSKIEFSLYNLAYKCESPIKTIRHERTHYFQYFEPKFYNEYFEKAMDALFKSKTGLLEALRANDPHGLQYYNAALEYLKDGWGDGIKEDINDWRKRRGLSTYSESDFNNMFIEDIAMEFHRNLIYDEILADSFSGMKRVAVVYNKYGVKAEELNEISNLFKDAINRRYKTKIMFSKDIDSAELEAKKKKGLTFKSIETTEEIVNDTAEYIEGKLGSGYKVHFPDNFRNFVSKSFTEINSAKRAKTQAKHLSNIILETQITQDNKVIGTLDDLLDASAKTSMESAIEGIISTSADTPARTKATLPFEKALNRAVKNVQNAKELTGRAHVWQNLRNSIHNTYDRYLELTDDSVAKGGYLPLLNIFNDTHWNGSTSYKLGSLRETVETALELYNEDSIRTNFGGLQYSPEIHDALLDLEASLPARKEITTKAGTKTTRDVSLDEATIQKLIDLGRLVKRQIQNQITRDATEIRPAVREGIKTIQGMSYSKRDNLAARMYRAWKRGFAPAYVVIEQMLGSNSTLSRKITYEMQMGFNQKQLYKGAYSDLINKKLKELGIKKNFDTKTFTIDGHKLTADQALSLYISLQVETNRNEINSNGFQYILAESGKEMKLSTKLGLGVADELKTTVESVLPENYRKFGDFLLETMNDSVKSEYMKMFEKKFGKYAGRNEIGKIGDKSYWMLFRSYQKATNVEKAMRNPAGVFTHAKARVDTQNAVLINGALSSFMSYVDSLGSELYVKPIYRDVISILNTKTEVGTNGKTLSQVLAETVGEKDFNYLMTSLADVLGVNPNKVNDMFSKAMSTFSVAKLSLNIGTMLKQFASIWTSNIPMYKSIKGVFSNIFKSDAVKTEYRQLVDEIGGLKYRESSKGVLLSNADSVGQFGEKIARVGMYGISKVDLFTVSSGVVSLMHIAQDQFGYKIGTEENKNWVKEHWTEFELSQIGNSALSKNAIARGDYGGITKAVFGFLQGANRAAFGSQIHKLGLWLRNRNVDFKELQENLRKAKDDYTYANDEYKLNPYDDDVREEYINAKAKYERLKNLVKDYESFKTAGGKAIPVNTAMGLMAQGIFVSLINELMKHIKGKKDWDEWELQDPILWALNIIKSTFVDWVPFINTITSALGGSFERDENGNIKVGKGYDVQVPVIEIANDLVDLFNGFKNGKIDWYTIANIVGNMTGIPVSTLTSYAYGALKVFDPEIAAQLQNVLYGGSSPSLQTALKNYVEKGDYNGARKIINTIVYNRTGFVSERVLNELTKLYMSGYNAMPRECMTSYVNENGETVMLTAAQITTFQRIYKQSDKAVRELLQVQEYQSLTQEEQAKLIKKIYDLYYDFAKVNAVGGTGSSKLSNLLVLTNGNVNLGNLVAILNKVSQITETKRKSRKELVVEYINRQYSLSRQEKILVMYLAGYSLNDKNKRTLKGYLAGKGASLSNIKAFLG